MESTQDYQTAISWAHEILGPVNTPRFYIPPKRLDKAVRDEQNFSFILKPEPSDGMKYGQAFGKAPIVINGWDKCALDASDAPISPIESSESSESSEFGGLVEKNRWDFYAADTKDFATNFEELKDDAYISKFLEENTDGSSVMPGDTEILFWASVGRDALAAVVQWESGAYIIASVATKISERGKGLATQLIQQIMTELHHRGIDQVGLGVAHKNIAAKKVYERCGFKPLSTFINYFSESWLESHK